MSKASLRQLELLQMIPRYPTKVSTAQIKDRMESIGQKVSMRMIQRDLESLEAILPIICDDSSKPYGWSWTKDSPGLQPTMNLIEALTFSLAEQYLKPLMPNKSFKRIQIFFDRANQILKEAKSNQISRWRSRVRVESQWQRLHPPQLNEKSEAAIYDALLNSHQLKAKYVKRLQKKADTRLVNPLGIVLRGEVHYLVCSLDDKPNDIRHLPMHRFRSAEWNGETAEEPDKGFSLDQYVKKNSLGYLYSDTKIKLDAIFEPQAGFHLLESPLSKNQKIVHRRDGKLRLQALVSNTGQLRWWLWGFAGQVEILSPKSLRDEFRKDAKKLARIYS